MNSGKKQDLLGISKSSKNICKKKSKANSYASESERSSKNSKRYSDTALFTFTQTENQE